MSWGLLCPWFKIRVLVAALAVVGSGLDTIPTPLLAAAGFCESVDLGTNAADAEEERDATTDEANDLALVLVLGGTRGEQRPLHVPRAELLCASSLRSQWPVQAQAASNPPQISLTIRLCRFTC